MSKRNLARVLFTYVCAIFVLLLGIGHASSLRRTACLGNNNVSRLYGTNSYVWRASYAHNDV